MLNEIWTPKIKGMVLPNGFAMLVIGLTRYLMVDGGEGAGIFILSEFVIVPLLMGMISAWFWKDLDFSRGKNFVYTLYNSFIAIALSYIFLGEGVICLLIVSPLIIGFIYAGIELGDFLFEKNKTTLNVSVLSILFILFISDALSKHEYENMVTDTIVINATPDKIWRNVVAFEKIKRENTFWLFKIGLPSPVQSTVTGYYKGAGRKCIFSNGYVFDEKITTYEPANNLVFDITNQPKDPEIMKHIDIIRGQFLLKDNGNGTTTLIGNSWYKLYVFPVWYYDIWAQSIVRNVHTRVMEHIKELSEK
jgi:hypothetical protein